MINVSQIFHGNFRSAYLGLHRLEANSSVKIFGRWRDHERWAITAEARRR